MNESLGAGSSPDGRGESDGSTGEKVFEYASENGPDLGDLRDLAESGAITGLGGALTVLRGLGSLRRGETGRGLFRLATGVLLLALAVAQRRTRGDQSGDRDTGAFDQTDVAGSTTDLGDVSGGLDEADEGPETDADPAEVVDTGSDVEDVSTGLDEAEHDGSDDADPSDVVDTGPDVEDVDTGSESESDSDSDATDEEAGVSTDGGEVGVEETNAEAEADADEDEETN